jgi:hypothetical protein
MIEAERSRMAGSPHRGRERDPAVTARIKRSAWAIGVLAAFFYVGFIALNIWRSSAGF